MKRASALLLSLVLAVSLAARQTPAPAPAQMPQIQNGRVEVRTGAAIDREIAAVSAPSSADPVWVAWRVPMVPGDRDMCSWYGDRLGTIRGMLMDEGSVFVMGDGVMPMTRPQITPPTGPVPLEAGTGLVVLARAIGGQVERLRTVGDDCPMDAGGRAVYWLSSVTSAESIRFLTALTTPRATDRSMFEPERRTAETAVRAIGYHQDPAANAALDGIAADHPESSVRRQAASTLASLRGAHGVQTIVRLLERERNRDRNEDARRSLIGALGQSREAAAVEALRPYLRDAAASIRAEAIHYFVLRGGLAVVSEAIGIATADADAAVRRRAVSAIGRLPGDAGVPQLLTLARGSDAGMRKEAVNALSQSRDPRAVALMEEILKR
jgi:hypothetical protein